MKVRELALSRFSEKNIREGAPMATLEEVLVPIYLLHRYQVEAASKVLGGLSYTYALRGDGQKPTERGYARFFDDFRRSLLVSRWAFGRRLREGIWRSFSS